MKTYLRFKTKNELKKTDYRRLIEFLADNPRVSIELLPSVDLEFVSVGTLVVAVEGFGHRISTEILFEQPVGFEVHNDLKLDNETSSCLEVNRRSFKLSRIVTESTDLEKDLNMILRTVERIVNHTCSRSGRLIEQTHSINSETLDREFGMILGKEELAKRGEVPGPFGIMHAKGLKDAKERAGGLVPVYMERDKAYLYEGNKIFMLLPRTFTMKLLKISGPIMMAEDQFTDEEREALRKFSVRRYVKTQMVGGKLYYCDLDETTRKLILKSMQKRAYL